MKNLVLLLAAILVGSFSSYASNTATATPDTSDFHYNFGYGNSFIFVENGITFSVFPDGEFDFYINETSYGPAQTNISFNAGYSYNNYVQYDDYGAVIQVVNTPVFYDHYGRVAQIGSIPVLYNNRRLIRIGGLHIYYNPYGIFSHYSGYINVYNRAYVFRPFHRFLVRPVARFCMVSFSPYRQYYAPVRYSYYRPYVNNIRVCYATVGNTYYYKQNNSRKTVYVNDRRVSRRDYSAYPSRNSRRAASKDYDKVSNDAYTSRRGYSNASENAVKRSRGNSSRKKSVSKRNTPVKRSVSTTHKKRKSVQKQTKRSANTAVKRQSVRKSNAQPKRSVKKTYKRSAPVKRTKTVRKSSGNQRKAVSKTRGRSSRSRS